MLGREDLAGLAGDEAVAGQDERAPGAALGQVLGLVRGHDDAQALVGQVAHAAQHAHLVAEVQGARGLVHHEEARALGQGARDEHHLALAAGELGVHAVGQLGHAQLIQDGVGQLAVSRRGRAEHAALRHRAHGDDVTHREGEGRHVVLGHVGHEVGQVLRAHVRRVAPADEHLAAQAGKKPQHRLEERGLAHAVGPQQAEHLARGDGGGEAAHDGLAGVAAGKLVGLEGHGCSVSHYSHSFRPRTSM